MAEMQNVDFEELVAKLDAAGNDEAAIEKVFAEAGLDEAGSESEELSEEDLENVAGGELREAAILKWIVKNTDWGSLSWKGMKMAARGLYDYAKYGNAYKTYSQAEFQKVSKDLDKAIPKWIKKINEWTS